MALAPATRSTTAELPAVQAVMQQAGTENFTVASRLLPANVRRDLLAVYGYARLVDDIGDEAEGDRMALLAWVEAELFRCLEGGNSHPVLTRAAQTIRSRRLEVQPFIDLIDANRQDQVVHEYQTYEQLLDYCKLSAVPVGRIVLGILDVADGANEHLSDDVCTGLQITEHLQDVAEDCRAGRVYLPLADLDRHGMDVKELRADVERRAAGPRLRAVVGDLSGRARTLLGSGGPLVASLPWRPAVAVAAFGAGGLAALEAIGHAGNDVLAGPSRPQVPAVLRHLTLTLAAARRERKGGTR